MAGLESCLLIPASSWALDWLMGRVVLSQATRQVLCRQHVQVVADREHLGLGVDMRLGSQLVTARDKAKASILDRLKALDG